MPRRALVCSLAAALAIGCRSAAPAPAAAVSDAGLDAAPTAAAWPIFPREPAARRALLARLTVRAPAAGTSTELADVLASMRARRWAGALAGEARAIAFVDAWLAGARAAGRDAYVLFGVRHDTGAPIDSFRRLVGPAGARGFTHVTIEQLAADGHWAGVPESEQTGDSRALGEYMETGTPEAFAALARAHVDRDYTAWKFGYAERVLDLAVTGRATRTPTIACDMPPSLQRATAIEAGAAGEDELLRLRELHCLFALADAPPKNGPRAVAMLWGAAHVAPEGVRRWLPTGAAVLAIRVHDRVGEGAHVALAEPTLVPLAADDAALLLPDPAFAVDVDRVRDGAAPDAGDRAVSARASRPVRVSLDGVSMELAREERTLASSGGARTLVVEGDPLLVVGLPETRALEVDVDPAARRVRLVTR